MTALVTIAYNQPETIKKLFITARQDLEIEPFIYLHSKVPQVEAACDWIVDQYGGKLFKYKVNRGVAKSWNDGIIAAVEGGHKIIVLANDDLWFTGGDLRRLIGAMHQDPNHYAYSCGGYNISMGQQVQDHSFSCLAVTSSFLQTLGAFDENFFPAYNEDIDLDMRAHRAGFTRKIVDGCNVQHVGSATINNNPMLRGQNNITHLRNDEYFFRKWGINEDESWSKAYKHPFGNPEYHPWFIDPAMKENPYPGNNRSDMNIPLI